MRKANTIQYAYGRTGINRGGGGGWGAVQTHVYIQFNRIIQAPKTQG